MRRSPGFTLIELLVSTALASLLTAVCITAFQQGRANIERCEARVRMHANAQDLYANLEHSLSSLMQDCAVVTASTQNSGPGTGDVTFLFMRGKEDDGDYLWLGAPYAGANSDHEWEAWHWQAATQNLAIGISSLQRVFQITRSYKPHGQDDYNGQTFLNLDAPRRTLSATDPWVDLDSNLYFPSATSSTVSAISSGDIGDWTDVNNNLNTVMNSVSDFSLQIVQFNGQTSTIDDTATTLHESDGVWLDGRIASATTAAAAPNYRSPLFYPDTQTGFASSAIALRPRLVRVRFTVTDAAVGLSQTFSFSFALPGFAGPPPKPVAAP